MPHFMCVGCLTVVNQDLSSAQMHATDVCKNGQMLCVPCGKSVNISVLKQHSDCKLLEQVDNEYWRPRKLLPRLLGVLRWIKASPELTKEAEEVLIAATRRVLKLPIEAVLQNPKVVASPKLRDLVLTVYAREPNRFKSKECIERPIWLRLVDESMTELEMSEQSRRSIRERLLWPIFPASQVDFCEKNFKTPETRDLAMQVITNVFAAFETSAIRSDPTYAWLNHLLNTIDFIPMSPHQRKTFLLKFHTTPFFLDTSILEYLERNFPTQELVDLAELVITTACTTFANQMQLEQWRTAEDKHEQLKTNLSQIGDKLKKKVELDSDPADGKLETDKTEPQTKLPGAKKRKKGKPAQRLDTNLSILEPGSYKNVPKRKAESSPEESRGANESKRLAKKIKAEPPAKTMEKDNCQKGNVFPKPVKGKKTKKQN